MNIVFFGTPLFAKEILRGLIENGNNIVAIVTQPDRPKGRSLKVEPPPVKQYYIEKQLSIPLFQPEKASTPELAEQLKKLNPDLFLVVGYGEILKEFILDIPKIDCINVHTSLLPKYRGAAPLQRAIENGESKLGITIIEMVKKMDAGAILAQDYLEFDENTYFDQIQERLIHLSIKMLLELLPQLQKGQIEKKPQEESLVTFAPKITQEDLLIDWDQHARNILNKIRAYSPSPGAFFEIIIKGQKRRIKVLKAKIHMESIPLKKIMQKSKKSFVIGCRTESIEPLLVKPEGKGVMPFDAFIRGLSEYQLN